ncbi:alpha/beta hydrolase [Sphingobacterium psychroaquaticum]|uniref:carboxylesterase family protein n=1 Tax=Sphingobacterium psychroaquaticum TaxID=561061 RepID=UPI00106B2AB7|nr:prolyl oligopeptidase family serine peptidase [Sphingobacterium psychroaquaticum]QBQ42472.1 alpha/beta hydrolase [Sphingobacterium psychroaquaticum]
MKRITFNLFRKYLTRLAVYFFSIISVAYAQRVHQFTEGLYLETPYSYGREAVYSDEFLWGYYNAKTTTPKGGAPGLVGTNEAKWTAIQTDTSGFFRPQRTTAGNLSSPNNPPGPGRIATASAPTRNTPQQYRGPRSTYLYLTYQSEKEQAAILNIRGNSAVLVNGELHTGDPYRMGWMHLPIQLKKGHNEFYVRGLFIAANLTFPTKKISLSTDDLTIPDIIQTEDNSHLQLGVIIINNTKNNINDLTLRTTTAGRVRTTSLPTVLANSTRKVATNLDASAVTNTGDAITYLQLFQGDKPIDQSEIKLRSISNTTSYRKTFVSAIDNSLQYYAVTPAQGGIKENQALFFSVHGAGVEALGQAQAYEAKEWGTLVAPTNRRPRGFNWEDWGRLDALEVLDIAKRTLQPNPYEIYLTGHSMGGHGTWFLGATYPDKWAAIAPCAGYPTLKGYGSADGLVPDKSDNPIEQTLIRSSNQSDVISYASNYKNLGVYVLHGDADRTVSVDYARQMRSVLSQFHPDFSYYEYPGGSHWYSNESVDWKPLFDYFKWHKRKVSNEVNEIDFKTANPGISASYYWTTIYQQIEPLAYSHLQLQRDLKQNTITGQTKNIETISLNLNDFSVGSSINITLDSLNTIVHTRKDTDSLIFIRKQMNQWVAVPPLSLSEKGPHRNGTFKEAFNHGMIYVYGTNGSAAENAWALEKCRYDLESWYYRGNGSFDIVADKDFDKEKYKNQNIILIGNSKTNTMWQSFLSDCPITITPGQAKIGSKTFNGTEIGGYFVWKQKDNPTLSVGVITGTGIRGMKAATANQYFAGASGFPDFMFFNLDMLTQKSAGLLDAGFYTNEWNILN